MPCYKRGKSNNIYKNKNKQIKGKENYKKGNVFKLRKRKDNNSSSRKKENESSKTTKNNNNKLKSSCSKRYRQNKKISFESKKLDNKKWKKNKTKISSKELIKN